MKTLRQAARHLARDGVAMCGRIIRGLHRALAPRKETDFHLRDASFAGEGLQQGVADGSWERMHDPAALAIRELAEARRRGPIPWPSVHEVLAIVTHAKIFRPPTPLAHAIDQVDAWLESPRAVLLAESGTHWATLRATLEAGRISGPLVHDACIAALGIDHGIEELWTADRDFSRFPGMRVRNPLIPPA